MEPPFNSDDDAVFCGFVSLSPIVADGPPSDSRLLDACRAHHRVTESLLDYDCWSGNCDHEECVEHDTDVCAECMSFAWGINDEYVPVRALAENCPILVAMEAIRRSAAPDLDKLLRALDDGLTSGGLIRDDARIVRIIATKVEVEGWTGAEVTLMRLA